MKSGLSKPRLGRLRDLLDASIEHGDLPGYVALVHRRGETYVAVGGALAAGGVPSARYVASNSPAETIMS